MNRPYIFCHMMTSLDGKITGKYMQTKEGEVAGDLFYEIAFGEKPHYKHQGWLSGRITTDENFTFYEKPALDENAQRIPDGDYIVNNDKKMYYVSVDPSGKLGWQKNTLTYIDTTAHIIEVLTEKASNAYRVFLRKLNIPYIIAGKDALDYEAALTKLKELFGIETLMLGGGGILNWTFIRAGMCDEVSVVIAPCADGATKSPSLFETGTMTEDAPVSFSLENADVKSDGTLWLRYKIKKGE